MSTILYSKIVYSCCAVGCTNRCGDCGKRIFPFPNEKYLRDKWIVVIKREQWTPSKYSRIFTTTLSPVSWCKCGSFLCLFVCFFAKSQPEGHFIPIMYLQFFPTSSKLLKLPAVIANEKPSALLSIHSTSPLELESEVWHFSLKVLNRTNKKQ